VVAFTFGIRSLKNPLIACSPLSLKSRRLFISHDPWDLSSVNRFADGQNAVPKAFRVDGIEGVEFHPYSMTI